MTQKKKKFKIMKTNRRNKETKLTPSGIIIRLGAMAVTVTIIILSLAAAGWLFGVPLSTLVGIYIGWRLLKLAFRTFGLMLRIVITIIAILILIAVLMLLIFII
jgi:hypothetical protein